MRVFKSPIKVQKRLRNLAHQNLTIGFVPTMGFLHQGHISLIKEARKKADIIVVSIFVNKKQFGINEDFDKYPMDIERDKKLLEKEDVDILFVPSSEDIYPETFLTEIKVSQISDFLCGEKRPGHFNGVALIVTKLFNIVDPDYVFFGQKDYQQCLLIKRLMLDLNYRAEMIICPIIREENGLAMSSRNSYLSTEEKEDAAKIYYTLKTISDRITKNTIAFNEIDPFFKSEMKKINAKTDYFAMVSLDSLNAITKFENTFIIAVAVFFGKTRLIDNIIIDRN